MSAKENWNFCLSQYVQIFCEPPLPQTSYIMGVMSAGGAGKATGFCNLITYLPLLPRFRMRGALSQPPLCTHGAMLQYRAALTFHFNIPKGYKP
jgi:hypothetical protein